MSMGFGLCCCDTGGATGICYMGTFYEIVFPTSGSTDIVMLPDATLTILFNSLTDYDLTLTTTSSAVVQWTELGIDPSTMGCIDKVGLDWISSTISDGTCTTSCGRDGGICPPSSPLDPPIAGRPLSSFVTGVNTVAAAGTGTGEVNVGGGTTGFIMPLSEVGHVMNFSASFEVQFNQGGYKMETAHGIIRIGGVEGTMAKSGAGQVEGNSSSALRAYEPTSVVDNGYIVEYSVVEAYEIKATLTGRIEATHISGVVKHTLHAKGTWEWTGKRTNTSTPGGFFDEVITLSGSGETVVADFEGGCYDNQISPLYGQSSHPALGFDASLVTDKFSVAMG